MKHLTATFFAAVWLSACGPGKIDTEISDASTAVLSTSVEEAPLALTVEDGEADVWTLTIDGNGRSGAFAFVRSRGDYRIERFHPVTPGVSVKRIGGIDAVVLPESRPRKVVLAFEPYTGGIDADYTPFIPFSDGGVAVFLTAFAVLPFESAAALEAIGGDLSGRNDDLREQTVTLRSRRSIMADGRSWDGAFTSEAFGFDYAYLGDTPRTDGESFTGIVDPGLPRELSEHLNADLPRLFSALDELFGETLSDKASVLFAAQGFEEDGISLTGGALPGNLLVLQAQGKALTRGTPGVRAYLRHFLAHESAHLYQMQTDGPFVPPHLDWIEEGMADAMASHIAETLDTADRAFVARKYTSNLRTCSAALSEATLSDALIANSRISYDCGDLLSRITVAALDGASLGDFWKALGQRAMSDGAVTLDAYFATMKDLGASDTVRAQLRRFVTKRMDDPLAELLALMKEVGIVTDMQDGTLQSISFPP